jgi:hypothetical protein
LVPIGVAAAMTPPWQSLSLQQAPQAAPQQIGLVESHSDLLTHLCVVRSQLSAVQPLPSLQSDADLH